MIFTPLRIAGLVLALLGSLLAASGWFWASHTQTAMKALQGVSQAQEKALQVDARAFASIARVDNATASVLRARRVTAAQAVKHKETKDAELTAAIAAEPNWGNEHVPSAVLNGLR